MVGRQPVVFILASAQRLVQVEISTAVGIQPISAIRKIRPVGSNTRGGTKPAIGSGRPFMRTLKKAVRVETSNTRPTILRSWSRNRYLPITRVITQKAKITAAHRLVEVPPNRLARSLVQSCSKQIHGLALRSSRNHPQIVGEIAFALARTGLGYYNSPKPLYTTHVPTSK